MGKTRKNPTAMIVILGDQLTPDISSLREADRDSTVVLMAEVDTEATYVRHHKKKIAFVFSAMRHFAEELRKSGWTVAYTRIDSPENAGSLTGETRRAVYEFQPRRIVVTEPGEWRLRQEIAAWDETLSPPVEIRADDRFLCSHEEFASWAKNRKSLRMEYFYREMRRKTGLLMTEAGDPEGGAWNFDKDNRKPARTDLFMPDIPRFAPDNLTRDVLETVAKRYGSHFGDLEPFWFAVTRADAEKARDAFISNALPRFGDYQDAMLTGEKFLYHSVLSIYLNAGLLDPLDLCRRVEHAYREGHAPLNAAEGFIRQIIGWREYVRGIYWLKMPNYLEQNALDQRRPLPDFYWTGETEMNCLRQAISQTREEAYAHHIQRLMVTGTFALIAGVDPKELHEWYLTVYADAYEWVELPNTLGMSQFADGGLLASKPYAASGNYINRMSDYCKNCAYDVRERTGAKACPFNYLYWDFLARNRDVLANNARVGMIYRSYDKFAPAEKTAISKTARTFLGTLA